MIFDTVDSSFFLLIPLGAGGGYSIPAIYPMGLPAGIPFYFQAWIADATGPQGFAASNALTTMTQ